MKPDYSTILFPPDQIAQLTTDYIKSRRDNKGLGIRIGLPGLDKDFLPLMPGELMSIIARPGNGKTGFMVQWARNRSKWLRENKITDRIVMYITLEQSVEELNAFNIAADERLSITDIARGEINDTQWAACLKSAVNRNLLPLWNIGYSSMTKVKQAAIDLETINGAVDLARDSTQKQIDIIFVDYLQRMPTKGGPDSKSVGVSDNLDGLKTLALRMRCPVVVGVQARRDVDETKTHVPDLDDGQWTSNIEQISDRVASLMRPAKYWAEGEITDALESLRGKRVTKNMMLVYVAKQKLAKDNFSYMAFFDPEYNKLDELEMRIP